MDKQRHHSTVIDTNLKPAAPSPGQQGYYTQIYEWDFSYFPVRPSQILMDLSNEAEARSLVSGEKSTSLTRALWPVIRARGFLSSAGFQRNKVKSSEPDTRRSGAGPCSTRARSERNWYKGRTDLNTSVQTGNSAYPNFIISLQSLLLQLFHWGKNKKLVKWKLPHYRWLF